MLALGGGMRTFEFGVEYPRSTLLSFVGSKQGQSGVLWGNREPGCIICTTGGRHGKSAGYQDAPSTHGWTYFGQGAKGDQTLENPANRRLASGDYSVLLFTAREPSSAEVRANQSYAKLFSYQGEFNILGWEFVTPSTGSRRGDMLVCFDLIRVGDLGEIAEPTERREIRAIRQQLNFVPIVRDTASRIVTYRQRSSLVRQYALLRSKGICEGCGLPGPFESSPGVRFLEVHHILRLADDGPDKAENVAALCPNCHRRAHFSTDHLSFRAEPIERVSRIEGAESVASGA